MTAPAREDSPFLTAKEAAAFVRKTVRGFDHWVRRRGVEADGCAGRVRLYRKTTLLRQLEKDRHPWRRDVNPRSGERRQ